MAVLPEADASALEVRLVGLIGFDRHVTANLDCSGCKRCEGGVGFH